MKKQLITQDFLFNRNKNGIRSLAVLFFLFSVGCSAFKGYRDYGFTKDFFVILGLGFFIGMVVFALLTFTTKKIKKVYDYHIVDDILLEKKTRWEPLPGNITPVKKYILIFLRSGEYTTVSSKEYNSAYINNRFFVIKKSDYSLGEIFDASLYEVSLDDFELKDNRYYPIKYKREKNCHYEK